MSNKELNLTSLSFLKTQYTSDIAADHARPSLLNENEQTPGSTFTDFNDTNIYEFRGNQQHELKENQSSATDYEITGQRDRRSPFN